MLARVDVGLSLTDVRMSLSKRHAGRYRVWHLETRSGRLRPALHGRVCSYPKPQAGQIPCYCERTWLRSFALFELLEDTRFDRRSAQHSARQCPGDAGGHDVLTRQEQARNRCAGIEGV